MSIGAGAGTFRVPYRLPGGDEIELFTDRGLFSKQHVDPGTLILLDKAPPPPPVGDLVDLGCGYGPIAIALALRSPEARVWAIDVNPRARELALLNVERLGLSNVEVRGPEEAPADLTIDALYSNPPLHTGKANLHAVLRSWLGRLAPEAGAWLVVKRSRGSDSLIPWLVESGFPARKLGSRRGYRVIEVRSGRS